MTNWAGLSSITGLRDKRPGFAAPQPFLHPACPPDTSCLFTLFTLGHTKGDLGPSKRGSADLKVVRNGWAILAKTRELSKTRNESL